MKLNRYLFIIFLLIFFILFVSNLKGVLIFFSLFWDKFFSYPSPFLDSTIYSLADLFNNRKDSVNVSFLLFSFFICILLKRGVFSFKLEEEQFKIKSINIFVLFLLVTMPFETYSYYLLGTGFDEIILLEPSKEEYYKVLQNQIYKYCLFRIISCFIMVFIQCELYQKFALYFGFRLLSFLVVGDIKSMWNILLAFEIDPKDTEDVLEKFKSYFISQCSEEKTP